MRMEVLNQLDDLEERRKALLDGLMKLTYEELAFKPAPDKWSILQVVEHLVLAEEEIFKCVPDQGWQNQRKCRLRDRLSYMLVVVVLRLGLPVPVVSREMEPGGTLSLAELRRRWDENHRWLRHFFIGMRRQERESTLFCHPVAGPLTPLQTMHLDGLHLHAHLRQIKQNKEAVGKTQAIKKAPKECGAFFAYPRMSSNWTCAPRARRNTIYSYNVKFIILYI